MTGDPLCAKLYKVEKDKITNIGVFPKMPSDIPDPHDVEEVTDGTLLYLKGYLYEWRERNLLTGNVSRRPVCAIDVVEWGSIAPDIKLEFLSGVDAKNQTLFVERNYTDCR